MSTAPLKISVIIPAYNAGKYLPETLSSIKNQDYEALEVIVIDGGSSDNTKEVIEEFADLVDVFVSEPDKGQLHALQKGIARSTGSILHWLNADDIMMPGTLAYVASRFLAKEQVDIVFSDDFAFEETAKELWVGATIRGLTYNDHLLFYRQMYSECVFWRASKTRLLDESNYKLRIYTDYAFFLNLRRGLNAMWVPKRLGAFRVREGQMSKTFAQRKQEEFEGIRRNEYRLHGWSDSDVLRRRCWHWSSFLVRQVLWPRVNSLSRRVWRALTIDRKRKLQRSMFFEYWLEGRRTTDKRMCEVLRR